ncbi:HD-GYP domain-containing protein [Aminomonas paucivorans]|uniref:Metal dependent phosphohydrolase n=1 Tax=Aminomonas paucivorans DSM 12260 TaxID=584708 RepID=E3CW36_9BACT|nr:HD-GYP domain-containing protein [Aminomonas paucivorans]EFQ24291.1 metal dependent phosphohydrolase [Aminomonas paucivorans DSM 12260]
MDTPWNKDLRDQIIGLGERSVHKSYYTQMRRRMAELEDLLEGAIAALSTMSEIRDPYTGGHQQRVAELAEGLARTMGLDGPTCRLLHVAGMLHDIGKISVPFEILNKPRSLTEAEFSLVRTHSESGYEILRPLRFEGPVAEIVREHHERLDGSGYPQGLRGDGLRLESRILAVADVVEAMSFHRPYRPALGISAALEEILAGRGTRFDPRVCDACSALLGEGRPPFTFSRDGLGSLGPCG